MALLRTKPVEDVLAQGGDDPHPAGAGAAPGGRLRRRPGPLDLMGFGIGIVIGTGIFTLTGVEAKLHAGPAIVVPFAVAGGVSVLAALCYAELASAVPTAGSAYTYAYATVGEPIAWIIAWDLVLEFALGASVVARGWSGYLGDLFGPPTSLFGEQSVVNVGAIVIVAVLGVVAVVGIRESARVTNVLVLIKVSVCVFVVVAGLFYIKASNLTPFVPPARPAVDDVSGLTRPLSQVLFGISPTAYGVAGILTAAAVVFFAYTGFEAVADLVGIGTLFAFLLVSVAVAILRRTRPDLERPFRVPFSPVLPILSALACLYLMSNLTLATWPRFGVWLVVGLVIYVGYGRRNARLAQLDAVTRPSGS